MSEAELHVLRARLNGGIRNKAARGELRRGLPIGFVWGEATARSASIPMRPSSPPFVRFSRASPRWDRRRVWLWFRSEGLKFPLQMHARAEIRWWVEASYTAVGDVLSNPVYAGAYAYGKTRQEKIFDSSGARKKRIRCLPRSEWQVFIPEHHPGFIDWRTYEANQQRPRRT